MVRAIQRASLVICLTLITAAVLVVVSAPLTQAQTSGPLATKLESFRTSSNRPAVGGVMFDSAKIGEVSVSGVRKLGDPTLVTTTDLWHIGSITKSFTSALAGKLVEQGQLSWSSTLGDLLGGARAKKFAPVTLAQVLSHRAGLPRDLPAADMNAMRRSQDPLPVQRQAVIDWALSEEPLSTPGAAFLYSNIDYVLVGAILEEKTGKAWEELVHAELLAPLTLTTGGFGAPGTRDTLTQPRGHRATETVLSPVEPGPGADNPAFLGPAGTLHMSIKDLARWGQEHLRGERGTDGLLLAATYKALHTPPADADYAFGWTVQERSGTRVIWHNGSNNIWCAVVAFDPAADRGVVIVTNAGGLRAISLLAVELVTGK